MKKIAIYNHKGGIGKTVTAVNLAYNLTGKGFQVLVIDLDPQGNASSFFQRYDLNKPSVKDMITGFRVPSKCVRRTKYRNLDIIPANMWLREVSPEDLIGGITTLDSACFALSAKYDYCIIDCPPSVDYLIEIVMAAVDDVIIPMKPDRFSADGLGTVHDIIREFGHGKVTSGCLFTQFSRNKDTVKIVNEVLQTQITKVYQNAIRKSSAVDHSLLVRRPLSKCASKSAAAQDYIDFLEEYLEEGMKYGVA